MSKQLLLLSGGGTLGPVTPLLAFAETARAQNLPYEFVWIGTRRGPERTLVEQAQIPFYTIASGKWHRFMTWRLVLVPFAVVLGFFQSLLLILKLRPKAVLSAGGFVSVPVAWAAWLLSTPIVLHEQDAETGLAIQLLQPLAAIHTSVWPRVGPAAIGNFLRPTILRGKALVAQADYGIPPGMPTILVLGGGTGAEAINKLIVKSLAELCKQNFILHLVGRGKRIEAPSHANYRQLEFLGEEIANAYAAASLVVCRAGMGTLSELALLAKPAIVIPMPGTHQEKNTALLLKHQAAVVLDQRTTTATSFVATVNELLVDKQKSQQMGERLHQLIPDGTSAFIRLVQSL